MWTFGELAPRYVGRPGTGWDPLFGMMDNLLARQVLFASEWPVFPMSQAVAEWKAAGLKQSTLRSYSARTSSTCSATGGTAMTGLVEFEITGGVAEARLNRPERLNAVTPDLVEELCGALERGIAADLAALIMAGNGSSFCYDLRQPPRQLSGAQRRHELEWIQDVTRLIRRSPHPVIAAVQGYALGAGCEFALGCDLVVLASAAVLGCPEVEVGLTITGLRHA